MRLTHPLSMVPTQARSQSFWLKFALPANVPQVTIAKIKKRKCRSIFGNGKGNKRRRGGEAKEHSEDDTVSIWEQVEEIVVRPEKRGPVPEKSRVLRAGCCFQRSTANDILLANRTAAAKRRRFLAQICQRSLYAGQVMSMGAHFVAIS